jgi:putative ABC transport system permease protein
MSPDQPYKIFLNFSLAFSLAWKSMRHHRLVSFATILGVAIGMCVVSTILIVDHNTVRSDNQQEKLTEAITVNAGEFNGTEQSNTESHVILLPIKKIEIIKQHDFANQKTSLLNPQFPTQELETPVYADVATTPRGEEDYQTMRLAIRMTSMFAFFIGSVIVFYTMRFSVAMRIREFALLLCMGEHQRNVSLSLVMESFILGAIGTLSGMLAAYPSAKILLAMGISTTGRDPSSVFSIPYPEIVAMVLISLFVVLLGVFSPVRSIHRLQISQVLQPRLIEGDINKSAFQYSGFSWLIPPMLLASYLAVRPFLENWLSVVYFFLLEAFFIIILSLVTIWLTRPFLRSGIRLVELALKHFMPLETLLTVRRIRLTSQKFVFSITCVILVFSLLGSLDAITRTLKSEIYHWSSEAITPYFYYHRNHNQVIDETEIKHIEKEHELHFFRLSAKIKGGFPIRLIHTEDYNRYRTQLGQPPFTTEQVIFSRTLAARFGVQVGDFLHIETATAHHNFEVIEISDAMGTFAEDAQYVDIKSFALFSDGNPLFRDNLEMTLGDFAVARSAKSSSAFLAWHQRHSLEPYYQFTRSGRYMQSWQLHEIDKDFLIFDFILFMTIILAFIGIMNTLLIQVHSRSKELSVLKTLGIDRMQMFRLLLVEGLVIGLVSAVLAVMLGTALGMVSVSFLNHFTLFQYEYIWSTKATLLISCFTIFTCCVSAIYPAIIATKISTSESLHYE